VSLLKVAVVGHTNTGKTSLLRTLMRDVDFGEVSDRPAVTREVEAAVLRAGGTPALELFDTPGLEDSIGLLETLDRRRGERRLDGIDVLHEFLESAEAGARFAQEAKALRQVLASDVALYVIDARDRVLGKHRDELEILGRCARPVVPVLNFTAGEASRAAEWRDHLARVNMHAVAEFDTVVFSPPEEERLFEKMRTLLDARGDALERLNADRQEQRRALIRSSSLLLSEMLIDVASLARSAPAGGGKSGGAEGRDAKRRDEAMEALKQIVREREQACVEQLLALHRFRAGDVESEQLPIENGAWGLDLFSPAALREFGVHAGGAAATGAMVGLTFDIMLAGLSLGTGTAAGAAIGGLLSLTKTHGRRFVDRLRGLTELRCDEGTLRVLASRQIVLIRALLRRGHASMEAVRLAAAGVGSGGGSGGGGGGDFVPRSVLGLLARAQVNPHWSDLGARVSAVSDPHRQETVEQLAAEIHRLVVREDAD